MWDVINISIPLLASAHVYNHFPSSLLCCKPMHKTEMILYIVYVTYKQIETLKFQKLYFGGFSDTFISVADKFRTTISENLLKHS